MAEALKTTCETFCAELRWHGSSPGVAAFMARILVVEDDEECRRLIVDSLRGSHDVHTASNGSVALEWLEANVLPDLILLDVDMPVMSGAVFRAHQLASERLAEIPVVWVSATMHFVERLREAVHDRVLQKPFSIARLQELVNRFAAPAGQYPRELTAVLP
jgi:CheY-like chemotaxis protein